MKKFFDKDFWKQLSVTSIGVFLGLWANGLIVNASEKEVFLNQVKAYHYEIYNDLKIVSQIIQFTNDKQFYMDHMSLNETMLNNLLENSSTYKFSDNQFQKLMVESKEKIESFNTAYPEFAKVFLNKDLNDKKKEWIDVLKNKSTELVHIFKQSNDYLVENQWDNKNVDQQLFHCCDTPK